MLLATLQQNFQSLGNVTHPCNLCYNVKLRLLMESLLVASSNTFLTIVARQVAVNVAQCNRSCNVQFVSQQNCQTSCKKNCIVSQRLKEQELRLCRPYLNYMANMLISRSSLPTMTATASLHTFSDQVSARVTLKSSLTRGSDTSQ